MGLVSANIREIVVFSSSSNTFLGVGHSLEFRLGLAKNYWLKLKQT